MEKKKEKVLIIKTGYSEILIHDKNHSNEVSLGDICRIKRLRKINCIFEMDLVLSEIHS